MTPIITCLLNHRNTTSGEKRKGLIDTAQRPTDRLIEIIIMLFMHDSSGRLHAIFENMVSITFGPFRPLLGRPEHI